MEQKPPISVSEVDLTSLEDELGIERPGLDLKDTLIVPPAKKDETVNITGITKEEENELLGITPTDDDKEENKQEDENIQNLDIDEEAVFSQLGEGLVKEGILPSPEDEKDFKWTQESFIQQLEVAKQQGAQTLLEELVSEIEGGADLFQSIFVDKVPITSFAQYTKSIEDYSTIDVTTISENQEKNQIKVVSSYLKSLGQEDDEIESQIEYLKDTQKLEGAAVKYKVKLVEALEKAKTAEISKSKALEQNKIREKQQFVSDIATELKAVVKVKEIEGFPVTEKYAQELYKKITVAAYKMNSTGQELTEIDKKLLEIRKDPKKYILLAHLIDNDLKIEKAVKKEASKQNSRIFNYIKKSSESKPTQDDPMLDLLKGIKK